MLSLYDDETFDSLPDTRRSSDVSASESAQRRPAPAPEPQPAPAPKPEPAPEPAPASESKSEAPESKYFATTEQRYSPSVQQDSAPAPKPEPAPAPAPAPEPELAHEEPAPYSREEYFDDEDEIVWNAIDEDEPAEERADEFDPDAERDEADELEDEFEPQFEPQSEPLSEPSAGESRPQPEYGPVRETAATPQSVRRVVDLYSDYSEPGRTQAAEQTAAPAVLGDVVNSNVEVLGDTLAPQTSLGDSLAHAPVAGLASALDISERYQIIAELFGGDADACDAALAQLDEMESLEDAVIYIEENFSWNPVSPATMLIMDLLDRKFS